MNAHVGLRGVGMTSERTRARMIERLREQGIKNEEVLMALGIVPRHIFVEPAMAHRAYEDTALPLILGQTISQPYIVARMIELLLEGRAGLGKTLEVGAGCGYQAAVLAQLTREVYGIERLASLLARAPDKRRRNAPQQKEREDRTNDERSCRRVDVCRDRRQAHHQRNRHAQHVPVPRFRTRKKENQQRDNGASAVGAHNPHR
jgi:hypothetical protein